MVIRNACPADNDRLLEIERHAPQGKDFKLISERNNYFVRAARFEDPIMIVAEDENSGNILGVIGVGPANVLMNGVPAAGGLLFDGRSNSLVARGLSRGLYYLWQAMLKQAAERKLDFLFAYIINENERSLSIALRSGMKIVEEKESLTIPVHRPFTKHIDENAVAVFHDTDIIQDLAFLKPENSGFDLLPGTRDHELRQRLSDHYMYAKICAGGSSLKIWDTAEDYKHRVLSMPEAIQKLRPVFGLISKIMPFPRLPVPGDELRHWFLYDLIIEKPADLPVLLEKTRRLAISCQVDYLAAVVSRRESLYASLARYAWMKQKFSVLFLPIQTVKPPSAPTYFDMRYL
jgi:hypothetical protein